MLLEGRAYTYSAEVKDDFPEYCFPDRSAFGIEKRGSGYVCEE